MGTGAPLDAAVHEAVAAPVPSAPPWAWAGRWRGGPTVLAGLGQPRPGVTKINAGSTARHAILQVS